MTPPRKDTKTTLIPQWSGSFPGLSWTTNWKQNRFFIKLWKKDSPVGIHLRSPRKPRHRPERPVKWILCADAKICLCRLPREIQNQQYDVQVRPFGSYWFLRGVRNWSSYVQGHIIDMCQLPRKGWANKNMKGPATTDKSSASSGYVEGIWLPKTNPNLYIQKVSGLWVQGEAGEAPWPPVNQIYFCVKHPQTSQEPSM